MKLYTPVLCRPTCNLFMKDHLEDNGILHSGEGGDVWRGRIAVTRISKQIHCVCDFLSFDIYLFTCIITSLAISIKIAIDLRG